MNDARSASTSPLLKKNFDGHYEDSLSTESGSHLSLDFCSKVLGKPCAHYGNPNKNKNDKKLLVDVQKVVTVYTLIEETANPFVTEKSPPNKPGNLDPARRPMSNNTENHNQIRKKENNFPSGVLDPERSNISKEDSYHSVRKNHSETAKHDKNPNPLTNQPKSGLIEESVQSFTKQAFTSLSTTKEGKTQTRDFPSLETHPTNYRQKRRSFADDNSQTPHSSSVDYTRRYGVDSYPVKDVSPGFVDKTLQTSDNGLFEDCSTFLANAGVNTSDRTRQLTCSKVQTTSPYSMSDEVLHPDLCKCCRYPRHRRRSPPETPRRYSDRYEPEPIHYARSPKARPKDACLVAGRNRCDCCCSCRCQPRRSPNIKRCSCDDDPRLPKYPACRCRDASRYPPPYDGPSVVEEDCEDELELVVDQSDGDSSEGSAGYYEELPYQNNEEFEDLVQELEDSLQVRSKNRVQRTLRQFEERSKFNRPLEKPIIDYDEESESEEPIMRKISELTEKRRQMHKSFPCKGRACCTYKQLDDKELGGKFAPKPVRKYQVQQQHQQVRASRKIRSNRSRWRQDSETGEWYKVPGRVNDCGTSYKNEHVCSCTCTCGRYDS
ncbi:unnamed protein product [Phyllotreta striolata]|uniref:Uncharacterized protein n=1 Tax=Phyllotreta striolata TaxID=444603 RepID=A0A9N9XRU9_PHYSR|nr:unnamed protein product [Phyllotreta striolata]